MNDAIKLAIGKGGYKHSEYELSVGASLRSPYRHDGISPSTALHHAYRVGADHMLRILYADFVTQDPKFWQALGKALGWSGFKFYFEGKWQYTENPAIKIQGRTPFVYETWLAKALDYHELVLTGGDTESWWNEVLKQSSN
ncbi:MAG: hypothetical protein M3362_01210 [Acidobacteriota bacterium]|nr:hypothetical protein [Acidobacteriota bacterium]